MKKTILVFIIFFAFTEMTQAKDWQVDYAQSKLGFMGEQGSDKFMGGFKKFTAQISLNPDHPEQGKISVTVDTSSAFAGSSDRDEMLPQADWFDVSKFPQAQFTSTAIRKTGDGQYVADATLTIKGVTKNVTLPFTLLAEGDHWRAKGRTILMRNDFSIGQGMFSNENYVKHAVDVGIDIIAK
jgi:polyisoprenoid-binding protein YceI